MPGKKTENPVEAGKQTALTTESLTGRSAFFPSKEARERSSALAATMNRIYELMKPGFDTKDATYLPPREEDLKTLPTC